MKTKTEIEKHFNVIVVSAGSLPANIAALILDCERKPTAVEFSNTAAPGTLIGFSNAIAIGDDGWAQIAPFGDHVSTGIVQGEDGKWKRARMVQRITKENGDRMVAQFHNSRKGIKKFFSGCNIYVGHPDDPVLGKNYPDKNPKGLFTDMQTRADGIYGLPFFTNEGSEIIEAKKLRAFSGRLVECEDAGLKDGMPVYCPTQIASVGLTNHPQLPVHFFNSDDTLADTDVEADKTKHTNQMKKKLIAVCGLLGIQFANEAADDATTEAALDQVNTRVTQFANERSTIKTKLLALCKKVGIEFANEAAITDPAATLAQVEEKVTALDTSLASAKAQFTNERADRIKDELGMALTTGRITEAEKPTWDGRLKVEAQFANEITAIRALKPKMKTASISLTRGGREEQVDISDSKTRAQFANEVFTEIGKELKTTSHGTIYKEACKRHPALFEGMAFKEIKMPGSRRK